MNDELLDRRRLEGVAERLKALADPTRLAILHVLRDGELCVGEIVDRVGSSQANVSKHLAVLRHNGLASSRREGMNVYYAIEDDAVFEVCRLMGCCIERHAARQAREAAVFTTLEDSSHG